MRPDRRQVLRGALGVGVAAAVGALSGCTLSGSDDSTPEASPTTDDRMTAPGRPTTEPDGPLYIAHRGGGRNWPEMTAYAYQQASLIHGLQDLEVSVHLSADGVLVCNHDADTTELGSRSVVIAETPWADLQDITVSPRLTLDPDQPPRPLARFDEILSTWVGTHTLWVEPKVDAAVEPLFRALAAAGRPEHVVWKQPINFSNFARAQQAGYRTWGYVLSGDKQQEFARTYAADPMINMLGVWTYTPEEEVSRTVAWAAEQGKKTVMWAIRNAEDQAKAVRLGCEGLMTSDIRGLYGSA